VIGIVISLWKPVLVDRYFIICLPPLVLLAAVGLSQVRPSWISDVSLIVVLSLSARADFRYYSHPYKEDWRGATAYVVSHALPKDGILFYPGRARFGFDYYVRRLNPEAQTWQIVFPEPYDWTKKGTDAMRQPSDSLVRTIPKGYERVWLVLRHKNWNPMPQMETQLLKRPCKITFRCERARIPRGRFWRTQQGWWYWFSIANAAQSLSSLRVKFAWSHRWFQDVRTPRCLLGWKTVGF
jgi:hypothetical protein